MLNSKALKPMKARWTMEADYEDGKMTFLEKISYLGKKFFVWTITDNYKIYKKRLKRCYDFAKMGYHNYDWDFGYVYHLMEFKLKRVRLELQNGCAIQEEEHMDGLNKMIKVVRKLGSKIYENKYLREHNKKWGKIETSSTPNYDKDGKIKTYTWKSWRKNTKNASQEVKDEERKEYADCYEKGEQDRLKDIDTFADLLKKHSLSLWD
jgi:hypothetical protein